MAKNDLRSSFADISRRLLGRYDRLQHALETADGLTADEFRRLIRGYEDEIHRLEQMARFPVRSFSRW